MFSEVAAEDDCLAIGLRGSNVRFGSKADMCSALGDVRFVPIADILPNHYLIAARSFPAGLCVGDQLFSRGSEAGHWDSIVGGVPASIGYELEHNALPSLQ